MSVACRLRFGDSELEQLVVVFDDEKDFFATLDAAIERAHKHGLVASGYSLDNSEIELIDDERKPIVCDHAEISARYLKDNAVELIVLRTPHTPAILRLQFWSDQVRRGTSFAIEVDPSEPLVNQQSFVESLDRIRQEHTWYGRKLSENNKFRLYRWRALRKRKRFSAKKSLAHYKIVGQCDLELRPMVMWEWPPKLVSPPPLTGFSLVCACIIAIGFLAWGLTTDPPPPKSYDVTFVAEMAFAMEFGDKILFSDERPPFQLRIKDLQPGIFKANVLPELSPIQSREWEFSSLVSKQKINIGGPCVGPKVPVVFWTLEGNASRPYELYVNGFQVSGYDHSPEKHLELCPGTYRVKHNNGTDDVIPNKLVTRTTHYVRSRAASFDLKVFVPDRTDSTAVKFSFWY